MKKGVILFSILFLLLIMPLVLAEENVSVDSNDESSKINNAYNCLNDKIDDRGCNSLSSEEKIFSLLVTGDCRSEVNDDSDNDKCWPKDGACEIKRTAQAILALDRAGSSTTDAEEWLISQNETPEELDWFLQIESAKETTCTITYGDSDYSVLIKADKTINKNAGTCLSLSDGGWWLRISPSCYDEEFSISCDESFLTNLLFKKKASSTIHVSSQTTTSAAEGTTKEKVDSFCFEQGGRICDYEGSLWAAMTLNKLGYDVSSYLPYLIAMEEENNEFIPESFLYTLTGYSDFRSRVLQKQKAGFWDESGDKFYDTATALLAIPESSSSEKSDAIDWLLEVQDDNGCWQGNIRNTAFILYSVWPRVIGGGDVDIDLDCEDSGYTCMSQVDCTGTVLYDHSDSCSGVSVCCDTPLDLDLCLDQGGEICSSEHECIGGTIALASDTAYGETCCINGVCEIPSTQISGCELAGGICKSYGCSESEKESFTDTCDFSGDSCCMSKPTSERGYWWIWVLIILIVLVVLGIIFRDKLRPYWMRLKLGFGKSKPGPRPGPGFPSASSHIPARRLTPRRIFPPSRQGLRRPPAKKSGDLDDVLKKLRDMGK